MATLDRALWPPGKRQARKSSNALLIARALKDQSFYSRTNTNKKSVELLTPRLGASLGEDRLQARVFMDQSMIQRERDRSPEGDPVDLLRRFKSLLGSVNEAHPTRLIRANISASDPVDYNNGIYAHITLEVGNGDRASILLAPVLMGELIRCIDDIFTELDVADGVYGI